MKLTRKNLRQLIIKEFLDLDQSYSQKQDPQDKNSISLYCFRSNMPVRGVPYDSDDWTYFYTSELMMQYIQSEAPLMELQDLYIGRLFGDPNSPATQSEIVARFCDQNVDAVMIFDHSGTDYTHHKWTSIRAKNKGRHPHELISYQMIPNIITFDCK